MFNAIMAGDLALANRRHALLPDPEDPQWLPARDRQRRMLDRAASAAPASPPDLTDLPGNSWGELLSWIVQSIVFCGNLLILHSQLTAAQSVTAHFAKTGDPDLRRIDGKALLDASEKGFPSWVLPGLQNIRHAVVMAGSTTVLVLIGIN